MNTVVDEAKKRAETDSRFQPLFNLLLQPIYIYQKHMIQSVIPQTIFILQKNQNPICMIYSSTLNFHFSTSSK